MVLRGAGARLRFCAIFQIVYQKRLPIGRAIFARPKSGAPVNYRNSPSFNACVDDDLLLIPSRSAGHESTHGEILEGADVPLRTAPTFPPRAAVGVGTGGITRTNSIKLKWFAHPAERSYDDFALRVTPGLLQN